MEKGIPERLNEFIKYLKISVSEFERNIGVSNGLISKYINGGSKSLGSEKIETILRLYPNLNTNWLFTGLENMLNENIILEKYNKSENDEYHKTYHKDYHTEGKEQSKVEDKQEHYNNKTTQQSTVKPSKSEYFEFLKQEIAFKNRIIENLLQSNAMMSEEEIEKRVRQALSQNEKRPLRAVLNEVQKEVMKYVTTKEEAKLIGEIFVKILNKLFQE